MTGTFECSSRKSLSASPPRGMTRSIWSRQLQQLDEHLPVLVEHELDALAGQPGLHGRAGDDLGQDAVGAVGVAAAAQDDGVAGLETEGGRIDGDVRPGLVDHADDPERHPHLLDLQTLGGPPARDDLAHRVGQRGDVAQAARRCRAGAPRRAAAGR